MITKADLLRCWTISGECRSIRNRIERLRAAMECATSQIKKTPAKRTRKDRLSAQVAKLDELERSLVERAIALEEICKRIDAWAYENLTPTQALIVRLRYVDRLPWWLVADKANYSVRHCTRIHGAILEKIS